jgi:hypothetical protein
LSRDFVANIERRRKAVENTDKDRKERKKPIEQISRINRKEGAIPPCRAL